MKCATVDTGLDCPYSVLTRSCYRFLTHDGALLCVIENGLPPAARFGCPSERMPAAMQVTVGLGARQVRTPAGAFGGAHAYGHILGHGAVRKFRCLGRDPRLSETVGS